MNAPFTVGIIQDGAGGDVTKNVAASVERIREAAARGAQIICLKELFDAPYFCKAESAERFDIAEPIPGPTTERMQALAKELAVVLIVPLVREAGARRLPKLRGDHRRRRVAARRVPQDAHPRRPALLREVLLHAG